MGFSVLLTAVTYTAAQEFRTDWRFADKSVALGDGNMPLALPMAGSFWEDLIKPVDISKAKIPAAVPAAAPPVIPAEAPSVMPGEVPSVMPAEAPSVMPAEAGIYKTGGTDSRLRENDKAEGVILKQFSDINKDSPYATAIAYAQLKGLMDGREDGTFGPAEPISRGEFIVTVIKAKFTAADATTCMEQEIKPEWPYVFFKDVERKAQYAPYICVAKRAGIVKGSMDGTLKPDEEISFAEAAKILAMAYGYGEIKDDLWYRPYVLRMGEAGAVPEEIKEFTQNINRAQAAEMVYKIDNSINIEN
jgi:hypothetical protein